MSGVKKVVIILIFLAVFVALTALYIAPLQGANHSSNELRGDLTDLNPQYQETLPIQQVGLGSTGASAMIAFVMITHMLFVNLHLGGSWVAVGTESVYLRNQSKEGATKFKRIARSITLFNVILFSAGATFAIAGVLLFISLFPNFASYLFHIYWWPLLIEAVAFGLEILFLYTYWFSWDRISPKWHQVLGYAYAIDVFVQALMINMVASGMLTPGGTSITFTGSSGTSLMTLNDYLAWWFNGSLWQLQFHRLFAAISVFGFILAMLSVLHYVDRSDPASKRYWDWVGSYGIGVGLFGLLAQPVLGFIYMLAIKTNQPSAFSFIMMGPRAWEMLLMVGLLSALFLLVLAYFIDRRERILSFARYNRLRKVMMAMMLIAAICAVILVQPAWLGSTFMGESGSWTNPLGGMIYKLIALFILVLIGGFLVMIDSIVLADQKEGEWGNLSRASRSAAFMAGIIGMWIVVVMGFVRESARSPFTIFNIIPVPGGEKYPTPLPIQEIFIIWAIILVLVVIVFWFTSKVTSEHPEKAEQI